MGIPPHSVSPPREMDLFLGTCIWEPQVWVRGEEAGYPKDTWDSPVVGNSPPDVPKSFHRHESAGYLPGLELRQNTRTPDNIHDKAACVIGIPFTTLNIPSISSAL